MPTESAGPPPPDRPRLKTGAPPVPAAGPGIFIGLFLIALSTLMFEILLTRVFSVITYYHFAFLAVSIAMFGLTVGAILVYLFPDRFSPKNTVYQLSLNAVLFSASIILSFFFFTNLPMEGFSTITLIFLMTTLPFIFSGICICLALTKFPAQVGKLYAADLAGAALGCVLLIPVINVAGGPTTIFFSALLACLGGAAFSARTPFNRLRKGSALASVLLTAFVVLHSFPPFNQSPFLQFKWIKGHQEGPSLIEKWNSYSRIRVYGDPEAREIPFGWGLSATHPREASVRQLGLNLDANAYTVITGFDGNLGEVDFLKYDIINLAHHLRADSNVLVIGIGGGRDILSALAFNQRTVTGVEINKDIIRIVNNQLGDFTGHLDKHPRVTFINDEARSYIEKTNATFDIIQASLIDTFAASTAGAFALTENSLYTIEAWKVFLKHLSSDGILTFSRWYSKAGPPVESLRLLSLASAALAETGITNPGEHLVFVRCTTCRAKASGVGTILIQKEPFSDFQLAILDALAEKYEFEVIQSPRFSLEPIFSEVASGKGPDMMAGRIISPPTDDSPFFFNNTRLRDAVKLIQGGKVSKNPVGLLGALLVGMAVLTLFCIIIPLWLTTDKGGLKGSWPFLIYFAAIGTGFMLVEISQMQRLIIFLGHPTYALSVVLFVLLLSTSLGSYLTAGVSRSDLTRSAVRRFSFLLGVLIVFGLFSQDLLNAFRGSSTSMRILVASGLLGLLGVFMGMFFPLGIRLAFERNKASLAPWFWGINGVSSVFASVLAIAIALGAGLSMSFWSGFFSYGIALLSFGLAARAKGSLTI